MKRGVFCQTFAPKKRGCILFNCLPEIGFAETGEAFRPGDGAGRLSGMLSVFSADGCFAFPPFLKPIIARSVRCVAVDGVLENCKPADFALPLQFARDIQLELRQLQLRPGRNAKRPGELAAQAGGR